MDTWLDSQYVAENYVRSLVTPTFAPAIASSVILGILTVCLYTSYKRSSFLPFFHYANASLLYMLSFIFILIFHEEDDGSVTEMTSEKFLHAALFLISFAHFFVLLGMYRSLVSWVADGLGLNKQGIVRFGYLSIFLAAVPLAISIAADVLLVHEFYEAIESSSTIHLALLLKSIGSLINIILVLAFISIVLHFTRTAARLIRTGAIQKPRVSLRSSVTLLVAMGVVTFLRFAYDAITALSNLNADPVLDLKTYYALVVTAGIFMILMVYLGNITKIKGRIDYIDDEPTTRAKKMVKNFKFSEKEEIVPLSRAPMQVDEDEQHA
ncbi:hypothetical protein K501DRAFT_332372 [Backusella circina FSU 941]|nr:hypothetical protein K501DRAFT_332372 [Backusella circina FSU 941]